MQTSAVTFMSGENARLGYLKHPEAPAYDGIFFADLCCEPSWVYDQVEFLAKVCGESGIPFYIIRSDLRGYPSTAI